MHKFLFVIHSMRRGGAENQIVRQTNALVQLGHETHILVLDMSHFDFNEFEIEAKLIKSKNMISSMYFLRKNINLYTSVITFMYAGAIITEISLLFRGLDCRIYHSVRVDKIDLKYELAWRLFCSRRKILFNSEISMKNFIGKGLSIADRSFVINNIIPTKTKRNNGKSVSTVAHFRPQKDYLNLFKAVKALVHSYPDLVINCYGDTYNQDWMEEWIKNEKLTNNIMIHGIHKEISKVYEDSWLIVVPTFYEGTPNAVLEAVASGCRVLTADIPVNISLSKKFSGISLYKTGNSRHLAKCLSKILSVDSIESSTLSNDLVLRELYSSTAVINEIFKIIEN